jgi:antitoxin MazE
MVAILEGLILLSLFVYFACLNSTSPHPHASTGYHIMPSEYDERRDATDTAPSCEYALLDLMAQVTEENLHAPVDFGPPVGREAL